MNKQFEEIKRMAKDACRLDENCEQCHMDFDCKAFDYAERFYSKGYRKQSDTIEEFEKRFEYHLQNATFSMGQVNDIKYALKKATEEMEGENDG